MMIIIAGVPGGAKQFQSPQVRHTYIPTLLFLSTTDQQPRYYIFEHYRGYVIPMDNDPELHAYRVWHDWAFSLDSVKRTLPDKSRYLEHIGKYADSSARSKVANAVRRGVAAHEIEDDKDTY
jgi:hypothetical protein